LYILLAISYQTIKGEYPWRDEAMWFQGVKILWPLAALGTIGCGTYIMPRAYWDILSLLSLLFDKASSQASTSSVDDCSTLLPLDFGM
jgi:hypothetical protein